MNSFYRQVASILVLLVSLHAAQDLLFRPASDWRPSTRVLASFLDVSPHRLPSGGAEGHALFDAWRIPSP